MCDQIQKQTIEFMTISGRLLCDLRPGLTIEIQALLNIPVHYICWFASTPTGPRQCGKGQKASTGTPIRTSGIILFTYNPLIEYYNHNHLSLKIGYFINHLQQKSNKPSSLALCANFSYRCHGNQLYRFNNDKASAFYATCPRTHNIYYCCANKQAQTVVSG